MAFNVTAGQTYTVGIGSPTALGSYSLNSAFQATQSLSFTDWGSVGFNTVNDVSVAGERWFRVQATRAGVLSVQAAFGASGPVTVSLYNANMQQLTTGTCRRHVGSRRCVWRGGDAVLRARRRHEQ